MKKHFTLTEPYTVGQFDDDKYYYIFKFDVPIIHLTNEKEANTVAHWLNNEYSETKRLESKIENLLKHDENRKEYQRILEAKIRRLKERIRVLEK